MVVMMMMVVMIILLGITDEHRHHDNYASWQRIELRDRVSLSGELFVLYYHRPWLLDTVQVR